MARVLLLFVFVLFSPARAVGAHTPSPSCSHAGGESERPTVHSPSGTFEGSIMTSRSGRAIHSFRGIRYAEPPVGELRFEPPRLVVRYPSVVDATEEGPACPQPSFGFFNMSEDCLRLNVYTPRLDSCGSPDLQRSQRPLPVLVYIHAGGFYFGSGQSSLAGPQYLLDHDVVLVAINYRLGSLGFISTGDDHAPGNLGFKDQVIALRWIQRNIGAFGGNPGAVTLCGYSAGSFSVALHMLSPMSKGLFHRAIAMSGSPTAQWRVPTHQLQLAHKQAHLVGCPASSSREVLDCLRTKTWSELGDSLTGFFEFGNDPVLIWRPVVEPDLGRDRFLTGDPADLIRSGRIVNDVPLMLGVCELEFTRIAFAVLTNDTLRARMDSDWDTVAPVSFVYSRRPPRAAEVSRRLRRAYLGSVTRPLVYDNETAFALGRLYGDGLISFGVHRLSRLMSERLSSPVYYYRFNYTGSVSHGYYPNTDTPLGAVHHDELIYLFHGAALFPYIGPDSPHSDAVDRMTALWTNFAIRGDPNPRGRQPPLSGLRWPPLEPRSRLYLQINQQTLVVRSRLSESRYAVWEELFPLP